MKIDYTLLTVLVIIAVAVIVFLIWRNIKDEKDIDPELTDELEKQKNKVENEAGR